MSTMRYHNFDLEAYNYQESAIGVAVDGTDKEDAGNVNERFRVRVIGSPAGDMTPGEAEEVIMPKDLRRRLRQLANRGLGLQEMIAVGEELAEILFPPKTRELLNDSLDSLKENEGLRIRLRLETYALASVPWEYSYISPPDTPPDQKNLNGFLVLNSKVSMVRYEMLERTRETWKPIRKRPIRLVALMANPDDPPQYPKLELNTERQNIEQILAGVKMIKPEYYPETKVKTLQDALGSNVDIFHFSGHGEFKGEMGATYGTVEGGGFIVLLSEDGKAALFPAETLAMNLAGRGVRIALFGACEGGMRDEVNAWSGIVPALAHSGIPAVVGMQYTIRDTNADYFSQRFYEVLASHQPVDLAVALGRQAIANQSNDPAERDWGVPVLYLRIGDGEPILFPKERRFGGRVFPDGRPNLLAKIPPRFRIPAMVAFMAMIPLLLLTVYFLTLPAPCSIARGVNMRVAPWLYNDYIPEVVENGDNLAENTGLTPLGRVSDDIWLQKRWVYAQVEGVPNPGWIRSKIDKVEYIRCERADLDRLPVIQISPTRTPLPTQTSNPTSIATSTQATLSTSIATLTPSTQPSAPVLSPTATSVTQQKQIPTPLAVCSVISGGLRLRTSPNAETNLNVKYVLGPGTNLIPLGRASDSIWVSQRWIKVMIPDSADTGWVRIDKQGAIYVACNPGIIEALTVAEVDQP